MNGGYILVNASGVDFNASDPATIAGLYARLTEAEKTKKPVVIENAVNGSAVYSPSFATIYKSSATAYNVLIGGVGGFTVSNADAVTILS